MNQFEITNPTEINPSIQVNNFYVAVENDVLWRNSKVIWFKYRIKPGS